MPTDREGERMSETAEDILSALIDKGPPYYIAVYDDGSTARQCADCEARTDTSIEMGDPKRHAPSCIWRRATAWRA